MFNKFNKNDHNIQTEVHVVITARIYVPMTGLEQRAAATTRCRDISLQGYLTARPTRRENHEHHK